MANFTKEEIKAEKARRKISKGAADRSRKDALAERVATPPSRSTEKLSLESGKLQVEQLDTRDEGRQEAATAAIFEGMTAGHAAEVTAGVETLSEIISGDMTIGSFGASYKSKRNEYETILDDMEAKFPVEYNMLNISGHMVTTPISIPGSAAMALASGHGYAQPKKRSELMTIQERANAMAVGGAYEIGGRLVPVALGRGMDKARESLGGMFHQYMAGTLAEALGVVGKYKNRLSQNLRRTGRDITDWADNLLTIKDGRGRSLIEKHQTYSETYDKVASFKKELGEEIGTIVDLASDSSKTIKGDKVYNRIVKENLGRQLNSNHAQTKKAAEKYKDELKETFFVPKQKTVLVKKGEELTKTTETVWEPKDLSLSDLQEIKTSISNTLRDSEGKKLIFTASDDIRRAKFDNRTVGTMTGAIEDGVLNSPLSKKNPSVYSTWKKIKQDYGDLTEAEHAILKTIDKLDSPGVLVALKEALNYRGMVMAGISRVMGVPDKAAIAAGIAMNKIVSHPATPASMTMQLKKVSEAFMLHPEKYEKIAMKLTASAAKNNLALGETLAEANSTVQLLEMPLERTTESVKKRKEHFLTILYNKGMVNDADLLNKSLRDSASKISTPLLTTLSNNPDLAEFFVPGMGWDGKATNPEEEQSVESEIKSKYKLKEQNKILTKFRQDKEIPTEELSGEAEERKEFIYNKAKNKVTNPRY